MVTWGRTKSQDVVIIGAGIGGLSAALTLAARGLSVTVLELAHQPGGKMGQMRHEGVSFDTGPSLLTMPEVFKALLANAGHRFEDHIELVRPDPAFRYVYPDGVTIDIHHELTHTLESVRSALGSGPARELEKFLRYAGKIWNTAAPRFVYGELPSVGSVAAMGPKAWLSMRHIDAMSSMRDAINKRVRSPHLRDLLARYATYNGSDVRRAPATLNCIAHVELVNGGFGVKGGMHRLAEVIRDLCQVEGVRFQWGAAASAIKIEHGAVKGVETTDGRFFPARCVLSNADARHLLTSLLPAEHRPKRSPDEPSMSGWNAIIKASGKRHAAHTVLFPKIYEQEFADIFDRRRAPVEPTVYTCDQSLAHRRTGWDDGSVPLFVMLNAPALRQDNDPQRHWDDAKAGVVKRLIEAGLIQPKDPVVWERTPWGLAQRFPGSLGGIYGAASNSPWAAFKRPPNRWKSVRGLYLASGSAHPGGGVPLCALSGVAAARAMAQDMDLPERSAQTLAVPLGRKSVAWSMMF